MHPDIVSSSRAVVVDGDGIVHHYDEELAGGDGRRPGDADLARWADAGDSAAWGATTWWCTGSSTCSTCDGASDGVPLLPGRPRTLALRCWSGMGTFCDRVDASDDADRQPTVPGGRQFFAVASSSSSSRAGHACRTPRPLRPAVNYRQDPAA